MKRQPTESDLSAWSAEQATLAAHAAEFDRDLADLAAPAELGDPKALDRRKQVLESRAAALARVAELKAAVASGRVHLDRQRAAESVAEQAQALEHADSLRDQQLQRARKLDRAFATLQAAWLDYVQLFAELSDARRRAGQPIANKLLVRHLEQAMHFGAPRIADALGIARTMRRHAAPLEDLVVDRPAVTEEI